MERGQGRLSAQSIHHLSCPIKNKGEGMIRPYIKEKIVINGKSAGLSSASYDARIDHDLVLGVNPAHILSAWFLKYGTFENNPRALTEKLATNPPMTALSYTIEDFYMPDNVSAQVADKSSYARVFVSAFNTFFDPGFIGNATLELVNLGTEPVHYMRGDPVCQFIFDWLDEPTDRPYRGKYQHQEHAAVHARIEK